MLMMVSLTGELTQHLDILNTVSDKIPYTKWWRICSQEQNKVYENIYILLLTEN